jgi:ribosome-associated toxin RatA of RatAB toxin-antitoxin module
MAATLPTSAGGRVKIRGGPRRAAGTSASVAAVAGGERTERVAATPEACFALLLDFERYRTWQSTVRRCVVLERDDAGRGRVVETEIDLKVRRARYVLRYHYDPPRRIWWDYVEGDVRSISGEYRFDAVGEGATDVTYAVDVELGFAVPGRVARAVAERSLATALRELRVALEA